VCLCVCTIYFFLFSFFLLFLFCDTMSDITAEATESSTEPYVEQKLAIESDDAVLQHSEHEEESQPESVDVGSEQQPQQPEAEQKVDNADTDMNENAVESISVQDENPSGALLFTGEADAMASQDSHSHSHSHSQSHSQSSVAIDGESNPDLESDVKAEPERAAVRTVTTGSSHMGATETGCSIADEPLYQTPLLFYRRNDERPSLLRRRRKKTQVKSKDPFEVSMPDSTRVLGFPPVQRQPAVQEEDQDHNGPVVMFSLPGRSRKDSAWLKKWTIFYLLAVDAVLLLLIYSRTFFTSQQAGVGGGGGQIERQGRQRDKRYSAGIV
jgi:hypothetical protein